MQVFKLYCKLTKKNIGRMILYVAMFCGILFGAVIPGRSNSGSDQYINQTVKYAILDEDKSELSKGFGEYLKENHEEISIKSFDMVTVQDELYNRNIRAAVVIKNGFEEAFLEGHGEDYMIIYDIPDNTACKIFANNVSEYFEYVNKYINNGETTETATERAQVIMNISSRAVLAGEEGTNTNSSLYYFYLYMPWVLIAMMVEGLTAILIKLDRKEVKNRIECSAYHFVNMNGEIALGVFLTGAVICAVLFLLCSTILGSGGKYGYLFVINMCIMMFIAIAIAFILSKFIKNAMAISMATNVISLGMSFLCGVFVPMEFLGEGVIKVAHFLPAYWYVMANKAIDGYTGGSMENILQCFVVELLFGIALFLIGMVVANKKRKAS